jgi:hypothetical protein
MLLNIEARIGELYESMPSHENLKGVRSAKGAHRGGRQEEIANAGLDSRRAQRASSIHRNPAAVAAVIKEAREKTAGPPGAPRRREAASAGHLPLKYHQSPSSATRASWASAEEGFPSPPASSEASGDFLRR